jgi:hypothetical protein
MLVSGSKDGTIVVWRITMEPVYEAPKGTGGAGLVRESVDQDEDAILAAMEGMDLDDPNSAPSTSGDAEVASTKGRLVSFIPVVIQSATFTCAFPLAKSLGALGAVEQVFCLEFFPGYSNFGRNREYTLAVGTGASLVLLRIHDMRVHESPLTSLPNFMQTIRKFQRHNRYIERGETAGGPLESIAGGPSEDVDHKNDEKHSKKGPTKPGGKAPAKSKSVGASKHSEASKSLPLRSNYIRIAMIHRSIIDANRYGPIRSLAVGIHQVER